MHMVWKDFSVSSFALQNILSTEDCIGGKNKIALHVRTCVWCVLWKKIWIFREYLDLAIFYSDGHRCSTKEYFIYGLFLDWMSLNQCCWFNLQQIFFVNIIVCSLVVIWHTHVYLHWMHTLFISRLDVIYLHRF